MTTEYSSSQVEERPAPGALPDLNAETYPFEAVVRWLDQAAYLNTFSVAGKPRTSSGAGPGFHIREVLHRFEVKTEPPSRDGGLRATNVVGEPIGRFSHRWALIPDSFVAAPGREPPPTELDPSRSQRFVMLDGRCELGGGRDGFLGFGTGRTFPIPAGGERPRLFAATVGTILEGFGQFKGLAGTYTHCGELDPHAGFSGNVLFRIVDPQSKVRSRWSPNPLQSARPPEPGITYLLLRGQKRDKTQKTAFSFGPDGTPNGLLVETQLRLFAVDAAAKEDGGVRSTSRAGQVIGGMTARIQFNLLNPGAPGTDVAPIPFSSYNQYTLFDELGRTVGSFDADGGEGRTFVLSLRGAPRQQALRFGGFGPLLNGTGAFSGIQGLMTDNSVVGISPHAIVTTYVLRIVDPDGRYRAAFQEASSG